jgi:hypothetical protein
MKTLLIAACAISAIALFMSSNASAEPTHPNEVGLYTTPDGYGATGTFNVGVPVDVYLVLTKPTDVLNGTGSYTGVIAFELRLNFNPADNLFKLADVLPPGSINIGDNSDIIQGYLEYIVGIDYTVPLPVIDEAAVLISFQFVSFTVSPIEVTLGPTSVPFYPGQMAFLGELDVVQVMHPVSGSLDAPVFIFNGAAVAVENESFGSVKALYR